MVFSHASVDFNLYCPGTFLHGQPDMAYSTGKFQLHDPITFFQTVAGSNGYANGKTLYRRSYFQSCSNLVLYKSPQNQQAFMALYLRVFVSFSMHLQGNICASPCRFDGFSNKRYELQI